MDEVAAVKMENLSLKEQLKDMKREVRELKQRAKSTEAEVEFLRKELESTLGDLSAEHLSSIGFTQIYTHGN
jgi:archaellum component FlaC